MSEIPIRFLTNINSDNPQQFTKFTIISRRNTSLGSLLVVNEKQSDLIISRTYGIENDKIICEKIDLGEIHVGKWISEEYDWDCNLSVYSDVYIPNLNQTKLKTSEYPSNVQTLKNLSYSADQLINFALDEKTFTLILRKYQRGYTEPVLSKYVIKKTYKINSGNFEKVSEQNGEIKQGYRTPDLVKWSAEHKPELLKLHDSYYKKNVASEMDKLNLVNLNLRDMIISQTN